MIYHVKNGLSVLVFLFSFSVYSFTHKSYYAGIGYQLENNVGKITQSDSGSGAFLGTASYPLILRYDYMLGRNVFMAPKLTYTLFPREGSNSTIEVTQWHLMFPFGMNFLSNTMEWSAGIGILNTSIKGSGGTAVLNNGNSTSTFALPGRDVDTKVLTLNFGTGYKLKTHFFGFDLMTAGTLSDKRTIHFMLSYLYQFGGSRASSSGRSGGGNSR